MQADELLRKNSRARGSINQQQTTRFRPTPDQIADTRTILMERFTRQDLHPMVLAAGGKANVLMEIRAAINEGRIANIGKNPTESIVTALYDHTLGLGVLDRLLENPDVEEINIMGPRRILVKVRGLQTQVTSPDLLFENDGELRRVVESLVRRVGKELSPHTVPITEIRYDNPVLRVHINHLIRDASMAVNIRRGRETAFTTEYLIKKKDFSREVADLLAEAGRRMISCIFMGVVNSGKTVMLEYYLSHYPTNTPIIVVDDAGDFSPTHPFIRIHDLPGTAYAKNEVQLLTLGSMTKAALREGHVLAVAEVRGAEEAGILIANASSMKSIATTFHGDTPRDGLNRLVSIAQVPPSPYAGIGNDDMLRQGVTSAFPLIVQMESIGDIRFISGIYHNKGWNGQDWELDPIVKTEIDEAGEITWKIVGDLNAIKPYNALDRLDRLNAVNYELNSPKHLLEAGLAVLESDPHQAMHLLFKSLLLSDTERVRNELDKIFEKLGMKSELQKKAEALSNKLRNAVKEKAWGQAREIIEKCEEQPERIYLWRIIPNYGQLLVKIKQGERETVRAEEIIRVAEEVVREESRLGDTADNALSWRTLDMILGQVSSLNILLLPSQTKDRLHAIHQTVLALLVEIAPITSKDYYRTLYEKVKG